MFTTGWTPNPAATEAFVASLPTVYNDQIEQLIAEDDGEDRFLYRALTQAILESDVEALRGKWLVKRDGKWVLHSRNQGPVGSCVGVAQARVMDLTAAIEIILKKDMESLPALFSGEGLYGLGREIGNMLGPGDGLYGSAIAKACREWGTLHELVYDDVDLRNYSASRCRDYGRRGVPDRLKPIAKEHRSLHTASVKSAEEVWSLVGQGYVINQCSNLGWQSRRDSEGVAARRGSWSHSMCLGGARRTTSKGDRVVLIMNSWGDNWLDGPYHEDQPYGSFYAHLKDIDRAIRQGDSFTFSSYEGFPPRKLPDWGFDVFG